MLTQADPTHYIVRPRSPFCVELCGHESHNEIIHGIAVRQIASLDVVVIEGDGDVPGIAHDVNRPYIAWIKTFVAFENACPGQTPHLAVGIEVNFGNPRLNI